MVSPPASDSRPTHAHLETEVAQRGTQIVLDGDRLRLQQLAVGQQHPQFLTAHRLHMNGTIESRPHHLRDATRIVTVRLVDLRRSKANDWHGYSTSLAIFVTAGAAEAQSSYAGMQ